MRKKIIFLGTGLVLFFSGCATNNVQPVVINPPQKIIKPVKEKYIVIEDKKIKHAVALLIKKVNKMEVEHRIDLLEKKINKKKINKKTKSPFDQVIINYLKEK